MSPTDAELRQLSEQLGDQLLAARERLVTAESCTGGWIAKAVTDVAGSSAWFDCGMAAYSYEAKQALLGVRAQTLEVHGAVSRETVIEMVSGALVNSGASIAGGGDRHRRPGRRQRGQAGRHRVDRLEAPRGLRQGRSVPLRRRPRRRASPDRSRRAARPGARCCEPPAPVRSSRQERALMWKHWEPCATWGGCRKSPRS